MQAQIGGLDSDIGQLLATGYRDHERLAVCASRAAMVATSRCLLQAMAIRIACRLPGPLCICLLLFGLQLHLTRTSRPVGHAKVPAGTHESWKLLDLPHVQQFCLSPYQNNEPYKPSPRVIEQMMLLAAWSSETCPGPNKPEIPEDKGSNLHCPKTKTRNSRSELGFGESLGLCMFAAFNSKVFCLFGPVQVL